MRIALAALLLLGSSAARAGDDKPPPPHRHGAAWYSGWSLIGTGGVATLLGTALSTRDDSASSTTGWVLVGVGTATWIGGAVILRLSERAKRY
jgi:hypothetical protein